MDKYAYYQTEDFLRDDSFVNWVLDPEGTGNKEWTNWIDSNPAQKEAAQKAIQLIRSFNFKQETTSDRFYADLKNRIDQTIAGKQTAPLIKKTTVIPMWLKAVAIATGLIIGGFALRYYFQHSWTTISTPYAAIKTVELPDGSTVVLNANTTLRYHPGFADKHREVWISGEGFFKVNHISIANKLQPFIVHANGVDVKVLGTEFTINSIGGGVMLLKGKVEYSIPDRRLQTIMQPNEYCEALNTGIRHIAITNPLLYTSWLEHKYRFENTPVHEVLANLRSYYGYRFHLAHSGRGSERISGTLELQNEQVMMKALGVLLNTSVVKKDNGDIVVE